MHHTRLIPAEIVLQDGAPYAPAFDDVYHSVNGGLAQAQYVFLAGNQLPARWQGRDRFVILETGFGLGLNFLATWMAWRDDPDRPRQLHYLALEKHPFSAADLMQLHENWPQSHALAAELCAVWPVLVPGFHRVLLDQGRLVLTLIFGAIETCLPQVDASVDAFYLDGFSPPKNPAMWSPQVLKRIGRLAAPGATLATYTVAAEVRRELKQAGFVCKKQPGFGYKRHMLQACFAPHWQTPQQRGTIAAQRHALVIGAGLAGAAICHRLALRGWQLTLIEQHPQPAQQASGNLAGIFMPLIAKDDSQSARLTRAAYLFALHLWQKLGGVGTAFDGARCGVLQLARDAQHAQTCRDTAAAWNYPADFVQWLETPAIRALLGMETAYGGWLFPHGGWANPAGICRAMLAACEENIQARFSRHATRLEHIDGNWRAFDAADSLVAQAPVVILANGAHACQWSQTAHLPLSAIRGQVTHMAADALPGLSLVVCREGYLTPASHNVCSVGASYDSRGDSQLCRASHMENLTRLGQMLPDLQFDAATVPLAGRVGMRCVAPDRLPLAGALPDPDATDFRGERLSNVPRLPGLYGLFGYASRGLIWAPLAAELLASQLEGEPLPIEKELAAALDPARFLLKAHRHGTLTAYLSGQHSLMMDRD